MKLLFSNKSKKHNFFMVMVLTFLMFTLIPVNNVFADTITTIGGTAINGEQEPLRIDVGSDGSIGAYLWQGTGYVNQYFNGVAWGSNLLFSDSDVQKHYLSPYYSNFGSGTQFGQGTTTKLDDSTVETSWNVEGGNLRITQKIHYTRGEEYFEKEWKIENLSQDKTYSNFKFIHGGDTYFGGNDSARSYWNPLLNMVYVKNLDMSRYGLMSFSGNNNSPADQYFGGQYYSGCQSAFVGNLPNTVDPNYTDAGYQLQWNRSKLAPGEVWTINGTEKWTPAGFVQVIAPSPKTAAPNSTISYEFTVQNFRENNYVPVTDTFDISVVSSNQWPASIRGGNSVTIDGGGAIKTVIVDLQVPSDAVGTNTITVTAKSQSDSTISNASSLITTVNTEMKAITGVTINPASITSGQEKRVSVDVNTLNVTDGAIVTAELVDGEKQSITPSVTDSGSVTSGSAILALNIPENIESGSYYIKIYVQGVDAAYDTAQLIINEPLILSSDATLSDLKIGGTTVTGFSADTLTYYVELPTGTTTVSAVTATVADSKANAAVTDATSLPGATTVLVTAEDGTTKKTYTINFTVAAPDVPKIVTGIKITTSPTKTAYIEGQSFDATGMKVTATYEDGTTAVVTGYTVTPNGALATTNTKVSVDFEGKTAEQRITVSSAETKTYSVTGNVNKEDNSAVSGADVKLMAGNRQIAQTTTDDSGYFIITNVPAGTYNLVISKGDQTITLTVDVSDSDVASGTLILPDGKKNSVVEVEDGTLDIVVGNLNDFFSSNKFTDEDKAAVYGGGSVEIKLAVQEVSESDAANVAEIKAYAGSKKTIGMLLDLTLNKTVTSGSAITGDTVLVKELENVLEIRIPLPVELQGKNGYVIYRYHNDDVNMITEVENSDGEYIVVSPDGKSIKLYTKKFSTYAIAYKTLTSNDDDDNDNVNIPTITVTNSDGGKIIMSTDKSTATINPDEGYVISDVIVDGKSVGVLKTYKFTDRKNHTISAIFVKESALPYYMQDGKKIFIGFTSSNILKYIAPSGTTVNFEENPKTFSDITDHWAKSNIKFVTEREIFQGTAENIFDPQVSMTRAMFVTVIGRLYERSYGNITGDSIFSDVDEDAYYDDYVSWANDNGIIKGVGDNRFDPNTVVTREQMAEIMFRFAEYLGKGPQGAWMINVTYPDKSEISEWAMDSAAYCQLTGIISGHDNGQFTPKSAATRAEVSAVIERFIEENLN